jgi:hypothetical protein
MTSLALRLRFFIAQSDIDVAYLNANLSIPNFMAMPPGYEECDTDGTPLCLELLKSLYGLRQAGREWNICLTRYLTDNGYKQAKTDPCLFIRPNGDGTSSFVLLYVDDMIFMASDRSIIAKMKAEVSRKFNIKYLGDAKHVLGLQLEQFNNCIYLGQPRYAKNILELADMWDTHPKQMPMTVNWQHDESSPPVNKTRHNLYRSLVMMLSYLAQQTRPDIVFAVNNLAQYQTDCREHDWKALQYLLRYLRGTWDYGLTYVREGNRVITLVTNNDVMLDDPAWNPFVFADASYAQEPGRKSRSGYVLFSGGAAVTWYCKKQPVVALSST